MNLQQYRIDDETLRALSREQRLRIYEEEKSRIQKSIRIPKWAWWLLGIYAVGCALMFFGISGAVCGFLSTREWSLEPEANLSSNLLNAAVVLVGPLLSAWLCVLFVAVPVGMVVGVVERSIAAIRWFAGLHRRGR